MTSPVEQRVNDLRLDRRALRAERARVAWWRRLVRARLDLAVAQAARPQTLGEEMAFQLPLDVGSRRPPPRRPRRGARRQHRGASTGWAS